MTLIVNWNTIDQTLIGSTDAEQEAFVAEARRYAADNMIPFDTIRNIQQPGFFLSADGLTQDDASNELAFGHFAAISDRICRDLWDRARRA